MATLVFDRNIGALETVSPWALPPGYTASAVNVVLSPHALAVPRAGTVAITGSGSGPTGPIDALFTRRDGGDETIWAANLGGLATPPSLFVRTGTTWANPSLSDTDVETEAFAFAAYNGKVFLAYAGTANRLHVYDLAAASPAIRRVGLLPPGKPTMANTGSGSYAATLRYYKVQMLIHQDGSDASSPVHAASELSVADSFTPSGSGTHARITMPTAVDSATHWRIYGSADGVTYYQITDDLAVGTTTYDDNVAPANYYAFNGVTAPEVGLYIPPPSVKYLATNGERLFMAGAYETTAASTETGPSERRVWFTRPLGATDEGDDEAEGVESEDDAEEDEEEEIKTSASDLKSILTNLGEIYLGAKDKKSSETFELKIKDFIDLNDKKAVASMLKGLIAMNVKQQKSIETLTKKLDITPDKKVLITSKHYQRDSEMDGEEKKKTDQKKTAGAKALKSIFAASGVQLRD